MSIEHFEDCPGCTAPWCSNYTPIIWTPEDERRLDEALEEAFPERVVADPEGFGGEDYPAGFWDDEFERQWHYEVKGG